MLWKSRSQWPRGLRRRSAAARLLRLWVRIPPGAWMSVVDVVCCQVDVCATQWSRVQRSPTDCDASLCVSYKPQEWGGHGPRRAAAPQGVGECYGRGISRSPLMHGTWWWSNGVAEPCCRTVNKWTYGIRDLCLSGFKLLSINEHNVMIGLNL